MNLEKGQKIKCVLKTGMILEGKVESFSNTELVLLSLDEKNLFIIPNFSENVAVIKLEISSENKINPPQKIEMAEKPTNPYDLSRNKSLAELKIMADQQEREIISNRLRNHSPTAQTRPQYQYPSFFKKRTS